MKLSVLIFCILGMANFAGASNLDPSSLAGEWSGEVVVKNEKGAVVCSKANLTWKIQVDTSTLTVTSSSECPENNSKEGPSSYTLGFDKGKLTFNLAGINVPRWLSPITGTYTSNSISIRGRIIGFITLNADVGPIENGLGNVRVDIHQTGHSRAIITGALRRQQTRN